MNENHFRSHFSSFQNIQINTLFFFTKWLPVAILDDRKSLLIAFLDISDQYATFILIFQNGRRRPIWMTENQFRSHFSPSRRKLTAKYEDITKSIALMCATDLRPTSIVGGKGFQKVMFKMNPDYYVPTPATINTYLGVGYDEEIKVLTNAVQGKDVAVTTDLWTSGGQHSYITVTGHHINADWELKANILASKTVHTGEHIAQHVKDIMQSFNIKLSSIVTDNECQRHDHCSNFESATPVLPTQFNCV